MVELAMEREFYNSDTIAIYLRTSGTDGTSAEEQLNAILSEIDPNGCFVDTRIYFDSDTSNRTGFKSLTESLIEGKHRVLATFSADRLDLAFNQINNALLFMKQLETSKVRLVLVNSKFDSSYVKNPFTTLLELVTKSKKILRSERARMGLQCARNAGTSIGRPSGQFDKEVRCLRRSGTTIRSIAERLDISTSTVQAALRRQSPEFPN